MIAKKIDAYLAVRKPAGPWRVAGDPGNGLLHGAVVIPSLAESNTLFATLHCLAKNPADLLQHFLVVVVVNHREDATPAEKDDNLLTLRLIREFRKEQPCLRVGWVDAATPGYELPIRGGGVGMARKIGFDLALPYLAASARPVLVALDADTLVTENYLSAIIDHFKANPEGGAVIPFCHYPADSPTHAAAIARYELFLRSYVLGLSLASSPYAFHTVGSAMACTVEAYLKMGGMNSRTAGEDFYFLQQLYRTSGVAQVKGTVVHPSPRASHRVPFGTGRSISRQLHAGEELLFYRPECFRLLRGWLEVASRLPHDGVEQTMDAAKALSPHVSGYLEQIDAEDVLVRLVRQNRSEPSFRQAVHGWFDGLKTMKFIHHLCQFLPRCGPEESVPALLSICGITPDPGGPEKWLSQLRRIQTGCSCSTCISCP